MKPRLREREWLRESALGLARRRDAGPTVAPPMFAPFRLREMEVANRITVSPMAMYSAVDGVPNDFHFVHLGERALGGAGLVFTEMTCVSPEGRISPGCTGMWNDDQLQGWKRIVDFVHAQSKAKICLQLGHSGAKGSTKLGWEGDNEPLAEGNWPVMAASDVPWAAANQAPVAMTAPTWTWSATSLSRLRDGGRSGSTWSSCTPPRLSAVRLHHPAAEQAQRRIWRIAENACASAEVFTAMREAWPNERPMSVRISATDWAGEDGITPEDAVAIGEAFARAGADLIDVSAGQTWVGQQPVYGRMFQAPFSDRIRNEARLATMAVGNIYEPDHANSILAAGRADLVALARPHLVDPMWTLRAAAQLGYRDVHVPPQYLAGMAQLARNLEREAEAAAALKV